MKPAAKLEEEKDGSAKKSCVAVTYRKGCEQVMVVVK